MSRIRRIPQLGDDGLTFADRLKLAMARKGIPESPQALATFLGLNRQTCHKWLTGEAIPETTLMFKIAQRFGVDVMWLAHGTGEMLQRSEKLTDSEAAVVGLCRELEETERKRWVAFGRGLQKAAPAAQPQRRVFADKPLASQIKRRRGQER